MKRPFLPLLVGCGVGILLGDFFPLPLVVLFTLTAFSVAALCLPRERSLWWLAVLLVPLGWTRQAMVTTPTSPHDLRVVVGDSIEYIRVRGVLEETPTHRVVEVQDQERWRALARVQVQAIQRQDRWLAATGTLAVSTPGELSAAFSGGQLVEIIGVIQSPRSAVAPGLFDYQKFLRRQGVYYLVRTESTNDWQLVAGAKDTRLTDRFTRWAQAALARGLPVEDEALRLTWAMTLGWQTGLTEEVSESFMRSGTLHIFAISGLHIAFIAVFLVVILRMVRLPRAVAGLSAVPLLWFYVIATGWQPSAIRSALMMTIVVGGWALRRPLDLLNSLYAAAFIILVWQPQQLFQAGFQLSFCVVGSLALFLPPLEKWWRKILQPDPFLPPELRPAWQRWLDAPLRFTSGQVVISLASWIGSLPLIAWYFHLVTPVSLFSNLVIVPLSSLALMTALGSLVCSPWLPWGAELFNHATWFFMTGMVNLSEWSTRLPGGYFYVSSPPLWACWVYALVIIALFSGGWAKAWIRYGIIAVVSLALLLGGYTWWRERATIRITVLPAHGGDATYVDFPGTRHDLLIDGGNEFTAEQVTKPFLRAQGVDRLPNLLLTHGDIRHTGGVRMLGEEFSPRRIITSPIRFRSPTYREFSDLVGTNTARRTLVKAGESFPGWRVLNPQPDERFTRADDNVLVLYREIHGVRLLFCSDLGAFGQNRLWKEYPELRADIVFAGIPTGDEPLPDHLLDIWQPRLIVINGGDLPATERATPELRARLEKRGIPVLYTGDEDAITLTLKPGVWTCETMQGKAFHNTAK